MNDNCILVMRMLQSPFKQPLKAFTIPPTQNPNPHAKYPLSIRKYKAVNRHKTLQTSVSYSRILVFTRGVIIAIKDYEVNELGKKQLVRIISLNN